MLAMLENIIYNNFIFKFNIIKLHGFEGKLLVTIYCLNDYDQQDDISSFLIFNYNNLLWDITINYPKTQFHNINL